MSNVNDPMEEPDELSEALTEEEINDRLNLADLDALVSSRFDIASSARTNTESIWTDSFMMYRGEYTPAERLKIAKAEARNPGASDVYIKVTKTKVQAAYGQILEILYSGNKFPLGVEASEVPEGAPETVHLAPKDSPAAPPKEDIYGFKGDGKEVEPGATAKSLLAGIYSKYMPFLANKEVKEGRSPDPKTLIELHPAEASARNMEKLIHDQLADTLAKRALDYAALECVIYGTGIIKGPFNYTETVHKWTQAEGSKEVNYEPYKKLVPRISHVSCWDFYPDPEAITLDDCEYAIERHLLNRSQMRDLTNMPFFNKDAIRRVLKAHPSRVSQPWEQTLRDSNNTDDKERYEVLEYWGTLDVTIAEAIKLPLEDYDGEYIDVIQVNIWTCQGEILRVVFNPFTPKRTPYQVVPYERHPRQIWGIGVPENMRDTQRLMNGHMRMMIDNLRLSGNVMLEVNEAQLVPGQEMSTHPGKIWRKQGGAPGQSIYGITVPNTSQQHMVAFDKARQLADEATGMPSFAHGQTGVSGVGRTAAGISMLMSAAAGTIKTVISNFDTYLLEPLGNAMFQWNMQFNENNPEIRGDLKIVASGTKSLMQKEVLTQRLMTFAQVFGGNQSTAPMVNWEEIIKETAITLGLNPDRVVNDPQTAMLYAEMIGKLNGNQQGSGSEANGSGSPAGGANGSIAGANPADSSGGGGSNIGVGTAPLPGEAGNSANP